MYLNISSMVAVLMFGMSVSVQVSNRAITYRYIFEIKYKKPNTNLFLMGSYRRRMNDMK